MQSASRNNRLINRTTSSSKTRRNNRLNYRITSSNRSDSHTSGSNGKAPYGFTYVLGNPELYAKHYKRFGIITTNNGKVIYTKPPWNTPPEYQRYNNSQKNRVQNIIRIRLKTLLRNILSILPNIIDGLKNINSSKTTGLNNDITFLKSRIGLILRTNTDNIDLNDVHYILYSTNNILKNNNVKLTNTTIKNKVEKEIKKLNDYSKLAKNWGPTFNN